MGNIEILPCCVGDRFARSVPSFKAPNAKGVTFSFDCLKGQSIQLGGETHLVSPLGFLFESRSQDEPPERYTVRQVEERAHRLRLCVSGRVLVCNPEPPPKEDAHFEHSSDDLADGGCIIKVCTRSRPITEVVPSSSSKQTTQVVDSGLACALSLGYSSDGALFVLPQISVVLANAEEALLVEEKMGPLTLPMPWCFDFALVDDGGRNIQIDLIVRSATGMQAELAALASEGACNAPTPAGFGRSMQRGRPLRACMQEFTTFNSQIRNPSVAIGYSSLVGSSKAATVHLQNLVVSEESFAEPVPEPRACEAWRDPTLCADEDSASVGSSGCVLFEGRDAKAASGPWHARHRLSRAPKADTRPQHCTSKFWHHIRYPDEDFLASLSPHENSPLAGEFWLSKHSVGDSGVYFHCSCTMAQALTMCIMFRFTCPSDYRFLIETQRLGPLANTHIPMNGLVLGVEADPRQERLVRMFLEHRNVIKYDMVLCECFKASDLARTFVDHEVHDSGDRITYRVTMLYPDGERQSAVLQIDSSEINPPMEEDLLDDDVECEPSIRFPIRPSSPCHLLPQDDRILVYTSRAYIDEDTLTDLGSPGRVDSTASVTESYKSAGEDGYSDSGCSYHTAPISNWHAPLIDSAMVIAGVEEPPFRCFPLPMS